MVDEDKLRGKKTHQAKMDTKIANRNRDPKGNFFDAEGS